MWPKYPRPQWGLGLSPKSTLPAPEVCPFAFQPCATQFFCSLALPSCFARSKTPPETCRRALPPICCWHLARRLYPCQRLILRKNRAPELEVLLRGEGVPWSLWQMGEAPVGRTWMPLWEETMYHPLSLAAIQCFLPLVSLLILLIYLKELRKRRGLRRGRRTGAPTPDPHACLPEEPSSADQISFSYK